MTKTVAAMAAPHQNAKNVQAPLFREKITHRTRQDARHVRPLASAIPIFNHRRHLMKTAVIALTMLFFATPALPASIRQCRHCSFCARSSSSEYATGVTTSVSRRQRA